MKTMLRLFFAFVLTFAVLGEHSRATQRALQVAQSATGAATSSGTADPALNDLLGHLRATAQKTDADLAKLKIDKWKTDQASKRQLQASADSIQRNLTAAVPELLEQVRGTPNSLIVNFRLYRDLNAVFDTFSSLTEAAGVFAAPEQYSAVSNDLAQLDQARQKLADRVDALAGTTEAELSRLRSRPAAAPAQAPAQPTKIVVDDNGPAKKKRPTSKTAH